MTPSLIVTIDTEEEGLWGGTYRVRHNKVENLREIPRFQALCDEHGVIPTYLVDTPVVDDDRAMDLLCATEADGRCEVGTHLHPWCAPPIEEGEVVSARTFMCNLPAELQRGKLERLTDAIAARRGRRPTSFRAGRYGLDAVGLGILADLGYEVDSSVVPFLTYAREGGPDYRRAPTAPYVPSADALDAVGAGGRVLEVPVTVGYNVRAFEWADRVRARLAGPGLRRLRLVGVLDRLRILYRAKLSPEQADFARMRGLVDAALARSAPCLVLMFHSSSLMAGGSVYVPDLPALESFYARLRDIFAYCIRRRGLRADTLTGFARRWREDALAGAA